MRGKGSRCERLPLLRLVNNAETEALQRFALLQFRGGGDQDVRLWPVSDMTSSYTGNSAADPSAAL